MTPKKVHRLSLGVVLLASAYPIYMGGVMLWAYVRNGGIDAADYPSYIIPYTPICLALIVGVALLPAVYKRCARCALPALSALGALLFLGFETGFERIAVYGHSSKVTIEMWQLLSCVATPLVKHSVWDSLSIRYNPSFKIHFYAIALLIVTAVMGVIYGFYKMAQTRDYTRKKPLIAQLIAVTVFVGLCILACFTAFFRTGSIVISPLSAVLMTLFFLVFGVTAGVYAGTWAYGKSKGLSLIMPSITAMAVTCVMYVGEMVMMNGELFRFGEGWLFDGLGAMPLSIIDVATVCLSGAMTYIVLSKIRR